MLRASASKIQLSRANCLTGPVTRANPFTFIGDKFLFCKYLELFHVSL